MNVEMKPNEIKDHFRIPNMEDCYLLLCDGPPVTVRSQQVRALNLLHALALDSENDNGIQGKRIAVIGGGAAEITFAAGAASLSAKVTLFEKSPQLLHMQLGCWHRPLHPEIFTWPEDTAYRPVSHLPQLGWTTGRAHDVADTLLAQFEGIQARLKEKKRDLQVYYGTVVQVTPDRRVIPHDDKEPFNLIILAVGFGVEELPYPLPWNSYWRIDPLDQTLLDEDAGTPSIVVVGSGDGALVEIMRSCIQSFEQGALLDGILYATLDDEDLRGKVRHIESKCLPEERFDHYCKLRSDAVARILLDNLRDTTVHWLVREATPFRKFSLPINRFIVSQIIALQNGGATWKQLGNTRGKQIDLIPRGQVLDVQPAGKGYQVTYAETGAKKSILCDNAIIRYGSERDKVRPERDKMNAPTKGLLSSIGRTLAVGSKRETILDAIRQRRDELNGAAAKDPNSANKDPHIRCRMPHWDPGSTFVTKLEAFDPRKPAVNADRRTRDKPVLHAHFVKGFVPDATRAYKYTVYRIKAWLEGLPEEAEREGSQELQGTLRVTYDLHPEDGRPISRVAFGPRHEIWLNTNSNYKVRARTNDGREWDLGWVHNALKSGDSGKNIKLDNSSERRFEDALNDVRTTRKAKDQKIPDSVKIPTAVKDFFDNYIIGADGLVLTVKSTDPNIKKGANGASINIDGPFRFNVFEFESGEVFLVLEPESAKMRQGSLESDIHMHAPWEKIKYVRTEVVSLGTIPHNIKISFYATQPPPNERGDELFWFYAYADNIRAYADNRGNTLRILEGNKYSQTIDLNPS